MRAHHKFLGGVIHQKEKLVKAEQKRVATNYEMPHGHFSMINRSLSYTLLIGQKNSHKRWPPPSMPMPMLLLLHFTHFLLSYVWEREPQKAFLRQRKWYWAEDTRTYNGYKNASKNVHSIFCICKLDWVTFEVQYLMKYLLRWVFVNIYKECPFQYHFWPMCIDASKYAAAGTSLRKVFHKKFILPSAASLLPYYTTNNHAIRSYLLRIYNSLFLNVTYVFPDEKMISILCKWSRTNSRVQKMISLKKLGQFPVV